MIDSGHSMPSFIALWNAATNAEIACEIDKGKVISGLGVLALCQDRLSIIGWQNGAVHIGDVM